MTTPRSTAPCMPTSWQLLRDERGTGHLAAFVVLFGVLTVAGVGILVDSARIVSTDRQCATIALEAARAGANALDSASLRSGNVVVDPAEAQAAAAAGAAAFVTGSGASLTSVSVDGNRVTVRVSATVDPMFPIMATRTVTKTASATAVAGITQEGQ